MYNNYSTILRLVRQDSFRHFLYSSAFCEALLMFVIQDLHSDLLSQTSAVLSKSEVGTFPPFGNKETTSIKIKPDVFLIAENTVGIAGEVAGGNDHYNGYNNNRSESHDCVSQLMKGCSSQSVYFGQKIMCQLFPCALHFRSRVIAEGQSFIYFASTKNHHRNLLVSTVL